MDYFYFTVAGINTIITIYFFNEKRKIIKYNNGLNEVILKQKEIINDLINNKKDK